MRGSQILLLPLHIIQNDDSKGIGVNLCNNIL